MTHAPKHAMLIALAHGLLSDAGQRRAQQHLDRCEVCRHAQLGHSRFGRLLQDARTLDLPTIDYDAMSLALRREAKVQATRHSRNTLFQALAVAAALALGVFGATRLLPAPSTPEPASVAATQTTPTTTLGPTNTSQQQAVGVDGVAKQETLAGVELDTGMMLRADSGELRIALWEGTEMVLAQGSLARVVTFRDHQLHLELLGGSVSNRVAPLQANERYVIEVNEHRVTVRGTRFVVTRSGDGKAQVALSEGKVDITRGPTDARVAFLIAPATWVQNDAALDDSLKPLSHVSVDNPALDEGDVTQRNLRLGKGVEPKRVGTGQVSPKAIQHLLARAAPLLRTCHEQSLRSHPDLPRALQLELRVSATGQVEDATATASEPGTATQTSLPADLVTCLRNRALTWHVPLQVAGPVVVRVPLQFGAAR